MKELSKELNKRTIKDFFCVGQRGHAQRILIPKKNNYSKK